MKKALSILLTIAMICQCLTFVTFSADEDVVEATKTTLIETVKDGAWSKDNSFKFMQGGSMKAPTAGAWTDSPVIYQMGGNADNFVTENGESYYYEDASASGRRPILFSFPQTGATIDGKLTAEMTFYDDSASDRTNAGGYIMSLYGTGGGDRTFPVVYLASSDNEQKFVNTTGGRTTTLVGTQDAWVDLKVEWFIQPDGIYRSSYWKLNGTESWNTLETMAGPMSYAGTKLTEPAGISLFEVNENPGCGGRFRVSNLSLVHTARPEVEATTATDDMAPETENFTVTFDQTMESGQTAIKVMNGEDEVGARVSTADNRTYTIEADLEGNEIYTVDVTGMKSAEGLYVLDTQNFTFTTTTAEGDTGAVKTTLVETVKSGEWSKDNSFKAMQDGELKAPGAGQWSWSPVLYTMGNNAANFVNDAEKPYYFATGAEPYLLYFNKLGDVTIDGKLSAEITYYDDSTGARDGVAYFMALYNSSVGDKNLPVAAIGADGVQKHVNYKGYTQETVLGTTDSWVNLKVDWYIQPDGIYRDSYWKLDSASEWNVLETNVGPLTTATGVKLVEPAGINLFQANFGANGGKLRVADLSLVHTSRAAVEESSIADGADDVDKNVNFTITFDQIMSTAQAEGAVKFVAGDEVINASLETEDYKTYTVSAALNGGTEYTVDVTGMKSAEGLYLLDTNNFAFTTVADAPAEDEEEENLTGATKTVLIETSKEGTWSKDNSFKVMQDGELKAPGAGQWSWSPVLYTMGNNAANFVNDAAKPYYFATGAAPYILNFSKMGTTVDGKLTAEFTYYDDSTATRDGVGYIMAIYGTEVSNDKTFQVVAIDKDRTQKHIDTSGYATETTFDATDKWVDLKIEWLIQPDGVYRNSW